MVYRTLDATNAPWILHSVGEEDVLFVAQLVGDVGVHTVVDGFPVVTRLGAVGFLAVGIPLFKGEWSVVEDVLLAVVSNRHWELCACLVFPGVKTRCIDDFIAFLISVDNFRSLESCVEQRP